MTSNLLNLISRNLNPAPWSEGDNIPWNDPEFSERMLAEHLTQDHDLASRKEPSIDSHVEWIFSEVLGGRTARILDLGCGPGLYTSRLAVKGCDCVGIDFSPASIRHAKEVADSEALSCTYHAADVRDGQFGEGFDLAMMIYGQLNVFQRDRGLEILKNAYRAIKPGGSLVLEVQAKEQIREGGQSPPSWYSTPSGLFAETPHIVLQDNFWNEDVSASTNRFSIIDGATGGVRSYSVSNEAYTEGELINAIELAGFTDARWFPSLTGAPISKEQDLPVIVATK